MVLGFVGRIVRDKGMKELAEAWLTLRESFPSLHLLLVGPFEPEDRVSTEVEELFRNDPRIHLSGDVDDVSPCYAAMDVCALPSYREGLGVVLIEAAAMKLPVVATQIPGCVDAVIDGTTGALVPPRNAKALAEAIAAYLGDPELCRAHGLAGRQRALDEFRQEAIWQAMYEEYVRLLRENGIPFSEGRTEASGLAEVQKQRAA
jgi:glycosyltransferase involved in cell wall biosynthesis